MWARTGRPTSAPRAATIARRTSAVGEPAQAFATTCYHHVSAHVTNDVMQIRGIRSDGRILRIAENTEPHSEKIISSGGLAKGVLEVIGGTAQKYGIVPGDRVAHPLFGTR